MKAQCSPLYASALSLSRIKFSYLFFIILLFVFKFSILLCFLSWYQSYLFLGILCFLSWYQSNINIFQQKQKTNFFLLYIVVELVTFRRSSIHYLGVWDWLCKKCGWIDKIERENLLAFILEYLGYTITITRTRC
jgi:hypothetical protein